MGPNRNYQPTPRVLVNTKRTPILFGVDWDKESPEMLNAITIDVLAYNRIVPNSCRLVVVCKDGTFLDTLSSITGLEVTSDVNARNKCEVWKLYYLEQCPDLPPNGKHVYQKKVSNSMTDSPVTMTQGREGYPSLWNSSDNVIVPPGRSPNINKIPPRYMPQGYNPLPVVN